MDNPDSELAKARRALRNWRWLAAIMVVLAAVVVMMAGVPYVMN